MGWVIRWLGRAWHAAHQVHTAAFLINLAGLSGAVTGTLAAILAWWAGLPGYWYIPMGAAVFAVVALGVRLFQISIVHSKAATERRGAPSAAEVVRRLSNAQLRERAIAWGRDVRAFEAGRRKIEIEEHVGRIMRSMEAREKEAESAEFRRLRESDQRRLEFDFQFQTRFRQDGVALLRELEGRLGMGQPHPGGLRPPSALSDGNLAGMEPATEAAAYLERLANSLP